MSILVPKLSLADVVVCLDCYRMFVIRLLRKNQGRPFVDAVVPEGLYTDGSAI